MKWQRLLNYLSSYLNSLTTFQKIEIYLIPLIIAFLIIYNFPIEKEEPSTSSDSNNLKHYKIKNKQLQNKINSVDTISIVKNIEVYAKNRNIQIKSIKVSNKTIFFQFNGFFKDILHLIDYCENIENFSKIQNITILQFDKEKIEVSMNISFANIIRTKKRIDNKLLIENAKNPFFKEGNQANIYLNAIVNDYVMIDNKWYTLGDNVGKYKIVRIEDDFIQLQNSEEIKKLNIFSKE